MKKVQKGFTLVELIVVITILAILGTIAFISLQGYSQDARNSKITADIRSLTSAVETSISDSTLSSITALVAGSGGSDNKLTTGVFYSGSTTTAGIGASGVQSPDSYEVGEVDFVALKQSGSDFKYNENGNERDYIAAVMTDNDVDASGATDDAYVVYQIAGQIPQADGSTYEAVVKGNWYKLEGSAINGLIDTAAGGTTGIVNGTSISAGLY